MLRIPPNTVPLYSSYELLKKLEKKKKKDEGDVLGWMPHIFKLLKCSHVFSDSLIFHHLTHALWFSRTSSILSNPCSPGPTEIMWKYTVNQYDAMASEECQDKSAYQSLPQTDYYKSGWNQRKTRPIGSEVTHTHGVWNKPVANNRIWRTEHMNFLLLSSTKFSCLKQPPFMIL